VLAVLDKVVATLWQWVLDHFTEYELYTYFSMIPSMALFWFFAFIFTVLDLFPSISPIYKWKIQKTSEPISKVFSMVLTGLLNHTLLLLLSLILYQPTKEMHPNYGVDDLPSWPSIIGQIILFAFFYDLGFYFIHRLMHLPWMYKHFHYLHHRSRIPCILTQVYFHPIDMFSAVLPVILPPILLNAHIATRTLWNCVLMIESMNAHCGYHFPWMPDSRAHDYHHSHPHKPSNFGSFFLVWDKLFGTDYHYREYLFSLEQGTGKNQIHSIHSINKTLKEVNKEEMIEEKAVVISEESKIFEETENLLRPARRLS